MSRSIRPGDVLLASKIPLPPTPCAAVALFSPTPSAQDPHDAVELARRAVISLNGSSPLLQSILPSVQPGNNPILYVYLVTPQESANAAVERLSTLQFDNLNRTSQSVFRIDDLSSADSGASARTHAYFLDAVRTAVISKLSRVVPKSPSHPSPKRLQGGFILERCSTSSDWASGWNQGSRSRPIVHFRLQVQISYDGHEPSHLVLYTIPIPTPYSGLPSFLNPGSPIVLMPYGTPAYFLNVYNGPSNTLVKQFRESLKGLGAGDWEASSDAGPTPFIIGWIRVENRQGEDKGTLFIWPSRLCLSYSDACNHRSPLSYIPEMPAPLQSSPQLPASSHDATSPADALDDHRFYERASRFQFEPYQAAPHSDPLRAFHSLTTSKPKDIRFLANEVGGYVDSVVRERERERERLKKEREAGTSSSPKLARPSATTPSSRPTASTPLPVASASQTLQPAIPPPGPNLSHAQQAQVYYPSPPQSGPAHPLSMENTSPDMNSSIALPPSSSTTITSPIPQPAPSTDMSNVNGFDLFNASSWQAPSDSGAFMPLDRSLMDFGMDLNDMDMEYMPSRSTATNYQTSLNIDFTDDDFSFFDNPSKSDNNVTASLPPPPSTASPADFTFNRPPPFPLAPSLDEARASGPGPPSALHAPWTPATHNDAPTPIDSFDEHRVPDLVPSSPAGPSPEHHHPSPETPTIQLVFDSPPKPPSTSKDRGVVIFDPIPFSTSHKSLDSKYSFGKFALPTPSPEPGYEDPFPPSTPPPSSAGSTGGWRARYNLATDPRFGVVKQLIGVKRKATSPAPQQPRHGPTSPWMDVTDDDMDIVVPGTSPSAMELSSDSESEDGNDAESECDSPQLSRPSTPPPSYLPLGPTLLHFHFDHTQLLSLSTPLRSPGAIALPSRQSGGAPLVSVPTPVSPAAALGAASEQSKSLELAAFSVAVEFVENPLWADTWKANNQRAGYPTTIWPDDVKAAAEILQQVRCTEGLSSLSTVFALDGSTKLEPFEPPHISIGKGDAVIQLLPAALRFWEKLGLGPKAGRKDVEVYAFYEDPEDQRRTIVDAWLTAAAATYKARQMGQFIRGCTNPANDALLPIRFDATFRKTLLTFASNIVHTPLPIVVLLFVPVTAMTMASATLRKVFSSLLKAREAPLPGEPAKPFAEGQVLFHLVPDAHLVDVEHSPRGYPLLEELCTSIYNRVRVSVERNLLRPALATVIPPSHIFQAPSFTLARPLQSKVSYVRAAHASLDVLDRFTLLHVGYQVSPCRKWVFACCVDQRGEEYALDVYLMDPEVISGIAEGLANDPAFTERDGDVMEGAVEVFAVSRVWGFVRSFASRADVEWQMVVTKLGLMSKHEVQVWTNYFSAETETRTVRQGSLHVMLLSADNSSPWTFVAPPNLTPMSPPRTNRSPSNTSGSMSKNNGNAGMHFNDASATFYALFPRCRMSATSPPNTNVYAASLVSEPSSPPASPEAATASNDDTQMASPNSAAHLTSPHSALPSPHHAPPDDPSSPHLPLPHPLPVIPLSTSTLIRVPSSLSPSPSSTLPSSSSNSNTIGMLHIHVLKYLHYTPQHPDTHTTPPLPDPATFHADVTRNFYELAVLAEARKLHSPSSGGGAGGSGVLPFHLAAVDAMRFCLDCDWEHLEGSVGEP